MFANSAGVGRTGVFITLSIVLERMRYEGVVDIFQTVKMLRTQRPATVQTEVSHLLLQFLLPTPQVTSLSLPSSDVISFFLPPFQDQYQFCYRASLEYLGSFDHYAT